jgi:hypothetical protein
VVLRRGDHQAALHDIKEHVAPRHEDWSMIGWMELLLGCHVALFSRWLCDEPPVMARGDESTLWDLRDWRVQQHSISAQ